MAGGSVWYFRAMLLRTIAAATTLLVLTFAPGAAGSTIDSVAADAPADRTSPVKMHSTVTFERRCLPKSVRCDDRQTLTAGPVDVPCEDHARTWAWWESDEDTPRVSHLAWDEPAATQGLQIRVCLHLGLWLEQVLVDRVVAVPLPLTGDAGLPLSVDPRLAERLTVTDAKRAVRSWIRRRKGRNIHVNCQHADFNSNVCRGRWKQRNGRKRNIAFGVVRFTENDRTQTKVTAVNYR